MRVRGDGVYGPSRIVSDWHALELLVVLVRVAGGELTIDGEHMLTTSTRTAGGTVRDILYEPLPKASTSSPPTTASTST
ncbi:hypothetical protein [Kitasatospora purpeofusca]|uniref:hypothetical protein n=1 Tax=Kitasatospora purpeofusca TaxID=67352 RepID=UPI00365A1E0E|nr:hypothetical protein KPHV_00220 [Kitasatospora purpeofusca]BEK71233.1 hypothetical protein KPHV_84600 [Kitasatospora purpeofusca]